MNKSLLRARILLPTLIILAVGGVGLLTWRFFVCPECFAVEQKKEEASVISLRADEQVGPRVNSPAPNFVLEDLEGNKVSLTEFAGRNVLLVFWATFCGWCERERPHLNKIAQKQGGKVEVIAIVGEAKEAVKKYLQEREVSFPVYLDLGGEAQIKYLAFGTPSHFIIDKEGRIAAIRPGYIDYQELLMLVNSLETK